MTEQPEIDFEAISNKVGILHAELASERFQRVVHGRLHADWCSDSALVSGTAELAPISASTSVEASHRSDATVSNQDGDGLEDHERALPAEKRNNDAMENGKDHSYASSDDGADSL